MKRHETRLNILSRFLCCIVGFCAIKVHAQLAAVPLVIKTYSTNMVNASGQPITNIVPVGQPALSPQTFTRAPVTFNSKVVKIPDAPMPTVVTNISQSANVINTGLAVVVAAPKIVGQKAIVQLKLQNNLADKIESARAVCFLLDEQGQMVGQSTKWVIGQNKISLEPKGEATFNFVITSPQPFTTTNLTAKISFSRVVLDGGKLANPKADVQIQNVN